MYEFLIINIEMSGDFIQERGKLFSIETTLGPHDARITFVKPIRHCAPGSDSSIINPLHRVLFIKISHSLSFFYQKRDCILVTPKISPSDSVKGARQDEICIIFQHK